jgi:limonene-1,2-epoxide hydrolase
MKAHADTLRTMIAKWQELDVEGVLACIHDDITWNNSGGARAPVQGKAAMRKALEAMRDNIAETKWRLFACTEAGNTVWMEGVDEFLRKDGKRVAIPYAGLLEFEDGLIRHWREYFDSKLIDRALSGDGVPPSVDAMLLRETV